jgi:hypothetical protein
MIADPTAGKWMQHRDRVVSEIVRWKLEHNFVICSIILAYLRGHEDDEFVIN